MKITNHAWLFDVDGVITDSEKRESVEVKVLNEILNRIKIGEPVALITGRGEKWLVDNVISQLEENMIGEPRDNLFISGEVGGVTIRYINSQRLTEKDESLSLPKNVVEQAVALVKAHFSQAMFFDETKNTLVTFQVHENYDLQSFKEKQEELTPQLNKLLEDAKLNDKFEIHKDRLAINIRSRNATKSHVTQKVLEWLASKNLKPHKFKIFGDSPSDLEMAQAIFEKGLDFEFIFVGDPAEISGQNYPFPITFTKQKFEKGTLEYLASHT